MKNNKIIIGLIGGMGPFAGIEFCRLILEKSSRDFGARNGADFPEIILDSVPVRDFISDTNNLPHARKMLISRVKKLNNFGCTTIAMVCNTGHILFPVLSKNSKVRMISLIDSVRDRIIKLKFRKVGLLATKTTLTSGLYKKAFAGTGIDLVNPDRSLINISEDVIRGVIANNVSPLSVINLVEKTREFLKKENLDGVILGCTELPLAFPKNEIPNVIDCLDVFSDKLLENLSVKNQGN